MAIALVTSGAIGAGGAQLTLNTTGANLVVAIMNGFSDGAPMSIADSNSNTWTRTIAQNSGTGRSSLTMAWFQGGTVGAGQVFTKNGNNADFGCFGILAYSGVASTPLDGSSSATANTIGATSQPGSITTTQNGDLLIIGSLFDDPALVNGNVTIDSGFAQQLWEDEAPGSQFGMFVADFVQTTAGAINPTLTRSNNRSGSGPDIVGMLAFKAAAAAPAAVFRRTLSPIGTRTGSRQVHNRWRRSSRGGLLMRDPLIVPEAA